MEGRENGRGGKEGGRGGAPTNVHRACLQLQSVKRQVAIVVQRFLLLRGKIAGIINFEASPPYLTHSVSPSQSLTGNPSGCVAGESEKEKNRRGKGAKKTHWPLKYCFQANPEKYTEAGG